MPHDPWLAIYGATPPMVRAQQLRQEWEDVLGEGRLEAIRAAIADAWQRSYAAADETSARWQASPIAAAAALMLECLVPIAAEAAHLIAALTAADGMQVFDEARFNEVVHEWPYSAAPVHDPEDRIAEVRAFPEPVGDEKAFVVQAADPPSAAPRRPLLKLTLLRSDQPCVELDGRPLQLSRIRTEILALLSARPSGMTSEELAADLYGDDGRPSAVRVQVFRLRKLLGPWIDTAPYRLSMDVESDVSDVRRLLERGAVREAAERHEGPLLRNSEAPGVVRQRDALEGWLRQAVMTADDPEALWAWAQSSCGRDDLAAWKRLLTNLDYGDPRRSLAAWRVGALRAAYGVGRLSSVGR